MLPTFTGSGLLPPGDDELTLDEVRSSLLVVGPQDGSEHWDASWRACLVDNLEVMVRQQWTIGIEDVFIDGSFVEDKDHPNDIDGYFVCDLKELATGRLEAQLNLLDPHKVWTWDPASRKPYRGYPAMIRNEGEYQEAVKRLQEERLRLAQHQAHLEGMGLAPEEVKRAIDPLRSFHEQLAEEVESYERLKRGDLAEISNLHGLGHALVALRIALGLTQRELAERLGVHESQVSRDERNEYHGITVDRASRLLDALGVQLRSAFEQPIVKPDRSKRAAVSG